MDFPTYPGKRPRLSHLLLAAALSAPSLAGCQPAMTDSTPHTPAVAGTPDRKYTGTVADWPLFFVSHTFGAMCFSTKNCRILYAGFVHGTEEPSAPSDSFGSDYPSKVLRAGHVGIRNFPDAVRVDWQSMDGKILHAEIDMSKIFADRLIRHNVVREDIPEKIGIPDPEIILEVNDRVINVYMRAFIPTKELQIPGNRYSGNRDDLIKVFSETY